MSWTVFIQLVVGVILLAGFLLLIIGVAMALKDPEPPKSEALFYDDFTLFKVRNSLYEALQDDVKVDAALQTMLNNGILFRERTSSN